MRPRTGPHVFVGVLSSNLKALPFQRPRRMPYALGTRAAGRYTPTPAIWAKCIHSSRWQRHFFGGENGLNKLFFSKTRSTSERGTGPLPARCYLPVAARAPPAAFAARKPRVPSLVIKKLNWALESKVRCRFFV